MKYLTAVNRLEPFETAVRKYKIQSVEKKSKFSNDQEIERIRIFFKFLFFQKTEFMKQS